MMEGSIKWSLDFRVHLKFQIFWEDKCTLRDMSPKYRLCTGRGTAHYVWKLHSTGTHWVTKIIHAFYMQSDGEIMQAEISGTSLF